MLTLSSLFGDKFHLSKLSRRDIAILGLTFVLQISCFLFCYQSFFFCLWYTEKRNQLFLLVYFEPEKSFQSCFSISLQQLPSCKQSSGLRMIDKKGSAVTRVLLEALPPFSIYTLLPSYFEILKAMNNDQNKARQQSQSLRQKETVPDY